MKARLTNQTETDDLRDALYAIVYELTRLFFWWKVAKELFWKSLWRSAFLADISQNTFRVFEDVLVDNILITFAKLSDPIGTPGKENLSLERICVMVKRKDKQLSKELRSSLLLIRKYCDFAIQHRHKRLAHFDYRTQMNLDTLPNFPVNDFGEAMAEIKRFIILAARSVENFRLEFEPETWDNVTDEFVKYLKQGMRYRELQDAGKIDPKDLELARYYKV